jgi:hypothetical protein
LVLGFFQYIHSAVALLLNPFHSPTSYPEIWTTLTQLLQLTTILTVLTSTWWRSVTFTMSSAHN